MADFKVLRTQRIELSGEKNDVVPPVHVDLHVDGKHAMSAQGVDDTLALQNLLTKAEQAGFNKSDLDAIRLQFNVSMCEPGDTLPPDE